MAAERSARAPAGLQAAGRRLWTAMHDGLGEGLRFGVHELEILARACQVADREAALREILDRDGLLAEGSRAQLTLHPALVELRLCESQVVSLLQRVSTEDTAGRATSPTSRRAIKAASVRWDRERLRAVSDRKAAGLDG
jgi:hypothetical protein